MAVIKFPAEEDVPSMVIDADIFSSMDAGRSSNSQRVPPAKAVVNPLRKAASPLPVTLWTKRASKSKDKLKLKPRARSIAVHGDKSRMRMSWAVNNSPP